MEKGNVTQSEPVILHPCSDGVNFWIWREFPGQKDENGNARKDILLNRTPIAEAKDNYALLMLQYDTVTQVNKTCEAA